MIIYAIDVDETMEFANGPVKLDSLVELKQAGHIIGICGNWAGFCSAVVNWHHLISFIGQVGIPKDAFLHQLKTYLKADDYVMVGNIFGVSGGSDDQGAAQRAGWRFIKESDFADGVR